MCLVLLRLHVLFVWDEQELIKMSGNRPPLKALFEPLELVTTLQFLLS